MGKVLVTGASGFVGTHLVHKLRENGYGVSALGYSPASVFDDDVEYVSADLTSPEATSHVSLKDVDVIFHLAGLAAVGPSFERPAEYLRVNSEIEINLFEECIKQNTFPKFLIISSSQVYDPNAPQPFTEDTAIVPPSPYAVSKLAQESIAMHYSRRGFEVVIARPFNHIGPGQSEGFLVSDVAKQIAELEHAGGGRLLIGNLDSQRDYTDVRDIVRAYIALAEKGLSGEIYNICSGRPTSGSAIVQQLIALSTVPIETVRDPRRARPSDVACMYGSCSKLRTDTGWTPEIPLEQTLKDALNDWRRRA